MINLASIGMSTTTDAIYYNKINNYLKTTLSSLISFGLYHSLITITIKTKC
jgi:hypothetical protein